MSDIATKLTTIAENQQKVYDAGYAKGQATGGDTEAAYQQGVTDGKEAEYDALWNIIQANGTRTDYMDAFRRWSTTSINPKYPIKTTTMYELFAYCEQLENVPVVSPTTEGGAFSTAYRAFGYCYKLKSIDFDIVNTGTTSTVWGMFAYNCYELERVQKLVVQPSQTFPNSFDRCDALQEIRFDGEIGKNINFQWSTKLSKDSITSIINTLSTTVTGQTLTLSQTAVESAFGSTTADEWTTLRNTKPNWTISLL